VVARFSLSEARARRAQVLGESKRWTSAQVALFESPYRVTVWRGANGIGKSVALAELTKRAMIGALPWQKPGPRTVILVGNTLAQLGQTLDYLFQLIDRRWLGEQIRFEGGTVKGQRTRIFDIVGGPGKGGKLILAVFDARNLAGWRAEVVISDEPIPETSYNELWPRLLGRGGRMYMGFTPTMKSSTSLEYLWTLVDDPKSPWIGELVTELTLEAVTPRGGLLELPWMTGDEIRQFERGVSALESDMRMGRTRHPRMETAYFSAWGPHLVTEDVPPAGTPVGIGLDHGSKPGAQRAILVAVLGRGLHSRVWAFDEYTGDGRSESEQDAAGVLAMLDRHGMGLEDVDKWIGDRAHGGYSGGHGRKSNERLREAIAKASGIDTSRREWSFQLPEPLRKIWTPRKYDGSDWEGMAAIHALQAGQPPRMSVHPRCTHLIEDFERWQGVRRDPHKDGLDALRYVVVPMVEGVRH
jgi:hypothetical protein